MTRRRQVRSMPLLLFVLLVSPLARAQEAPLVGFDDYVNKALRDWGVPGVADYPFKRVPETAPAAAAVALGEEELKKFAGKYESKAPPVELSVEMVGGKLKAVVPGQPVYTLVPVAAARFSVEGAPAGFFVEFEMAEGKVKSLTLVQGSGPSLTLFPKQ